MIFLKLIHSLNAVPLNPLNYFLNGTSEGDGILFLFFFYIIPIIECVRDFKSVLVERIKPIVDVNLNGAM